MKWLYDLGYITFALISLPKFIIRLRQSDDWRKMLRERMGVLDEKAVSKLKEKSVLWIHAVSVGEVKACSRLIHTFLEFHPDWNIAFSQTTPTGHAVAKLICPKNVFLFFAPFDISGIVKHVFSVLCPKLVVLLETEIWPNLIGEAAAREIPIGIVNGRISPRALCRYRLVRGLVHSMLKHLSFCLVQSERDFNSFQELGMDPEKMICAGNMKLDELIRVVGGEEGAKEPLSPFLQPALVLIGGSTSGHEEELLTRVFRRLQNEVKNLKLVLVPRHPERVSQITKMLNVADVPYLLYSKQSATQDFSVLVVDQMGVLASLYVYADVIFVGGSLYPRGGQNPIEAVRLKKGILHGPHIFNFHEVYQILDQEGGAICVRSEDELFKASKKLLMSTNARSEMGVKAFRSIELLKGATNRTLNYLDKWVAQSVLTDTEVTS
jgi:3-deoxy-D-manno-octulosonic-acid transferase